MKRHPLLLDLSKEHHQALVLAMKLQRGQYQDLDWRGQTHILERHFSEEEHLFAPWWASLSDAALQRRFVAEHASLRAYMAQRPECMDKATAAQFGLLLQQHVRFEERQLFAALQTLWPAQ